ncbi:MAG: aminopeptidase N [Parcubacteria group bacterium]|nr:aminopeptidase N [Parcubacteria group bacterium]
MAQQNTINTLKRLDYQPYTHDVSEVFLQFTLGEEETIVESEIPFFLKSGLPQGTPLVLNIGEEVELFSLSIDGRELGAEEYRRAGKEITIPEVPKCFTFKAKTRIHPAANTALEGLYASHGILITQCEAEGFRKITPYPDRPDVMAKFTVRMVAPKDKYPVLLSNGNKQHEHAYEANATALWHDPFPKPCYLFALVACDFPSLDDEFITLSGRTVKLQIFAKAEFIPQLHHAMFCLKQAMKWDEERFGREYDLDTFMIVGTEDFNMGAMENKGLNIFNLKYIVADSKTATDERLLTVQGVVAHEYFHNWSGNRITCRDWFQLSLKEGFTVFRDQEFSMDMGSRLAKRIADVGVMRTKQFKEDAGPLAHPVRPDEVGEIMNFYTVTVYDKGAEVVRMLQTILGEQTFRFGTDLYFERHDGQAVTCEDFVKCLEDAGVYPCKLTQFRNWYSQAGTPVLDITGSYDENRRLFAVHIKQSCPPTPGQPEKAPFHIPLRYGLLSEDCRDYVGGIFEITEWEETFIVRGVYKKPILSLNHDFLAPVIVNYPYTNQELLFLAQHDENHFNRWDASKRLASGALLSLVKDYQDERELVLDGGLLSLYERLFADDDMDTELLAEMLVLPSEEELARQCEVIDPDAIHEVREFAKREIADKFHQSFLWLYNEHKTDEPHSFDTAQIAKRRLKNVALEFMSAASFTTRTLEVLQEQFEHADNMSDEFAALSCLINMKGQRAARVAYDAIWSFDAKWRHDPNVLDSWHSAQVACPADNARYFAAWCMDSEDFPWTNQNRVRAVFETFAKENPTQFHDLSGRGYKLLADAILKIDPINPQTAAFRLMEPFTEWRRYDTVRQELMKKEMARILAANPSAGVVEKITKSLAAG